MSASGITVEGTITPDGILALDQKLPLPSGRVQVTVIPLPELPNGDPFLQRMRVLWEGQKARSFVPRTVHEVEAERQAMREEWEQRMGRIEQIQAEAEQIRNSRRQG
jgi:hypothetical protein